MTKKYERAVKIAARDIGDLRKKVWRQRVLIAVLVAINIVLLLLLRIDAVFVLPEYQKAEMIERADHVAEAVVKMPPMPVRRKERRLYDPP